MPVQALEDPDCLGLEGCRLHDQYQIGLVIMINAVQALEDPDRLGLEGCQLLLSLLHYAAPLLQPARRQVALESVHKVVMRHGLM